MKTSKEYKVHFKAANTDYGILTIPKGTLLTHQTANGFDEKYHFVNEFSWVELTEDGTKQFGLLHDLEYRGINVPKEYVSYDMQDWQLKILEMTKVEEVPLLFKN